MHRLCKIFPLLILALALCVSAQAASYFQFSYTDQLLGVPSLASPGDPPVWYTAYWITLDPGATGAAITVLTTQGEFAGTCSKFATNGCIVTFEGLDPATINGPVLIVEQKPLKLFEHAMHVPR